MGNNKVCKSKRTWKRCLLGLFLFSLFSLGISQQAEAAPRTNVTAKDTIDIYDTIDKKIVKVGVLLKGQTFRKIKDDNSNFYIRFGNGSAYAAINSNKVVIASGDKLSGENTKWKNSNTVVIPSSQIIVYSETNGKTAIAKINKGVRYPIVRQVGKHWYQVDIGSRTGYIKKNQVKIDNGIPVLTYHHMVQELTGPNANNSAVVKIKEFEKQMKYLKDNGFTTISINQLDRYLQNNANLMEKTVVITFDDGNVSTVNDAYPILKQNGFQATSFVIGNRIGERAPAFNPAIYQFVGLEEMNATSDVFQYQHHTYAMHTSKNGKPLMLLNKHQTIVDDTLLGQKSIAKLNQYAGNYKQVKYMAYPFGATNPGSRKALQKGGITLAFTTKEGNVKLGDERMLLNRQIIVPKDTLTSFKKKIGL